MEITLRIGVIGAGRIGTLHAEYLYRQPKVKLRAVSDLFLDERKLVWAKSLGVDYTSNDYAAVLNDPEIDAVFVCSSTDTHAGVIKEAAAKGKHIFCEKPISFDLAASVEAVRQARQAGVLLQVGFNRRFDHNFAKVREWVQSGRIGEPHLIKITSRDPYPPPIDYVKVSGGMFVDMCIHDFDMARFLSGSEVEEVYAQGAVLVDEEFGKAGDIDTAIISLRFESGALGVIDNSRQAVYGYDQRVEVFGSRGNVNVHNDCEHAAEISTADGVMRDKPKLFFLERYKESYAKEVDVFIECALHGTEVPVSGYDGIQAERIALAAKLSLQERRPVRLTEVSPAGLL